MPPGSSYPYLRVTTRWTNPASLAFICPHRLGPPMDRCPRCGEAMAQGFVGASSVPAGLHWFSRFATALLFCMTADANRNNEGSELGWLSAAQRAESPAIFASVWEREMLS